MKKIIQLLFLVIVSISCNDDFLDHVPDDRLTFEGTFSKEDNVKQYLANIYSIIPTEMSQRYSPQSNSGVWLGASDEAEYVWSWVRSNHFDVGDWHANSDIVNNFWDSFYKGIRSASTFIDNVNMCEDCSDNIKRRYAAEARILRAYYYYLLIQKWGPVVLLGEGTVSPDTDLSDFERNSMDECVAFITNELDNAIDELAVVGISLGGSNAGRMNRPFAMALKEKVLLLGASPLFNGNTDYSELKDSQGNNLISQTNDSGKWQAAAQAARDFLDAYEGSTYSLYRVNDENGNYSPYLSCRDVMLDEWNEEIVYARPRGWLLQHYEMTPYHSGYPGEVRGAGGLGATQEMVDAYFMANGLSIDDPNSGYATSGFANFQAPFDNQQRSTFKQWVNREPRFYVGITYNGSLWLNQDFGDIITTTWYYGNSGRAAGGNDYTPTGYIVRKNMTTGDTNNTNRSEVMLRLAEIYLDYVEALNEYNPSDPNILLYLNKIRNRAGIPEYGIGLPIPPNQNAMREAIHKERRVELAFENIRYFDVRRWKEGTTYFNGSIHGMDINATSEVNFYNIVSFETRVFDFKHYLWPIPQGEMDIDSKLVQNLGW